MKQLFIARAVLHRADIVSLDEPTAGLDPVAQRLPIYDALGRVTDHTAT
jgi:ABC-type multidrug transport system ATPase subunit